MCVHLLSCPLFQYVNFVQISKMSFHSAMSNHLSANKTGNRRTITANDKTHKNVASDPLRDKRLQNPGNRIIYIYGTRTCEWICVSNQNTIFGYIRVRFFNNCIGIMYRLSNLAVLLKY